MLGPNDIEDWTMSEEDRLRAEIRLLRVVQTYRVAPRDVRRRLGAALAARLARFERDKMALTGELDALLRDLRAAG